MPAAADDEQFADRAIMDAFQRAMRSHRVVGGRARGPSPGPDVAVQDDDGMRERVEGLLDRLSAAEAASDDGPGGWQPEADDGPGGWQPVEAAPVPAADGGANLWEEWQQAPDESGSEGSVASEAEAAAEAEPPTDWEGLARQYWAQLEAWRGWSAQGGGAGGWPQQGGGAGWPQQGGAPGGAPGGPGWSPQAQAPQSQVSAEDQALAEAAAAWYNAGYHMGRYKTLLEMRRRG